MGSFNKISNLIGWIMFLFAAVVYTMTVEPTTSLWDCGEFISAAYKLEVVHPPGAPLFLMIGRLFAWVATIFSDDPSSIAYAINIMSGLCTAFLVMFVCWSTIILTKLAMVGRKGIPEGAEIPVILGSGVVAAMSTTFATSVWFSAVEGEVYAMSSGFSGLVMWASLRWFITDHPKADRWLIFIAYMMGLSIGVHLLSLLAFPFLGVLFYYKKMQNEEDPGRYDLKTAAIGFFGGFIALCMVQYFIIPRVPQLAANFDYFFVNSFGMPLGSGAIFFILILISGLVWALFYAHKHQKYYLHLATMMVTVILIGFSSYGMVVVRASAEAAINMNDPSDPYSLLSYLNREQYGERPLLYGPHYAADNSKRSFEEKGKVYRPILKDGKYTYQAVDKKMEIIYDPDDMMLFPRLGHMDKVSDYKQWITAPVTTNPRTGEVSEKPTLANNFGFFFNYQIGYMLWRYFAWNFIGRQNALQGIHNSPTSGNWMSGIPFIDEIMLHKQTDLPDYIKHDKSRNTYYFLPFIFGILGLLYHISKRPKEALALGVMFLMTGLAIIVFTNQPPREPRERDYVLVGAIFTFCIWIGMAVPYIYELIRNKVPGMIAGIAPILLVAIAPMIMGFENWDDHSRARQYGARDYAINFLESCAPNALIFTYGDNDTYPLWYAQEVENIRPDVRVINFSLLAVDWYIDQLRRKINKSDRVKMTIPEAAYKGELRNYLPIVPVTENYVNLYDVIQIVGDVNKLGNNKSKIQQYLTQFASIVPAKNVFLPVDKEKAISNGALPASIPDSLILDKIEFQLKSGQFLMKDEIALMDIIATNAKNGWERPIYFAVTCRPEKIMGLKDYLNLEGMALRIVPYKTPSQGNMAILMGNVDEDKMFENIVGTDENPSKFKWGDFDKEDFFINESYMPSVHSLQYSLMRLTEELFRANDYERATATLDKFFSVFPHMNFPFDENRMALQALRYYFMMDEFEKGAEKLEIMTSALVNRLEFYVGLDQEDAKIFERETQESLAMSQAIIQYLSVVKDEDFKKKITDQLSPFIPTQNSSLITPENN